MTKRRYSIVDIETTGGRANRDKITEIGIVVHDGQQIIETFETLLNPEAYIPRGITELTGITQEMVSKAPKFYEVAKQIIELTEGSIFVAHNVRFDYSFIREEFARLGYIFTRRRLCTVRLSRKAFPDISSYSLENLIHHFDIPVSARHRALEDAKATTKLLEMILAKEENHEKVKTLINMGIKESRLPQGISLDKIHALPEACGVYYLHDKTGQVIYVGKSINIKKRIADHFADPSTKGQTLQKAVADISFEITGSELVALLLESHEIKRLKPSVNRAQRQIRFPFAIKAYHNEAGYLCYEVIRNSAKARKEFDIVSEYPSLSRAKGRLNHLVKKFELCAGYCHLHHTRGACFHYHLKQCHGACIGEEEVQNYNERAEEARLQLRTIFDEDFILFDEGRQADECSIVLIEDGRYQGFAFVERDAILSADELKSEIKNYISTPDTSRIIQRFMSNNPKAKLIPLNRKERETKPY